MKFRASKIFAALSATSLIWVFVGCAFVCGESADCAGESVLSFETPAAAGNASGADSCPIQASVKTTAPERIVFDFDSPANGVRIDAIFSPVAVLSDPFKFRSRSYRPPDIAPRGKRPPVLRI